MKQQVHSRWHTISNASQSISISIFLFSIISFNSVLANGNGNALIQHRSLSIASSPNYYCGLYCVYASAKRLGIELEFQELLQTKYLTGKPGSTAVDLKTALEDLGLKCDIVSNLSIEGLARLDAPVIVHTRAGASQKHFSHWMLFAGFEHGAGYKLYDPPFTHGSLSGAELQALWGGTALIVYRKDNQKSLQQSLKASIPSTKILLTIACISIASFCASQYLHLRPGLGMAATIILTCIITQLSTESFARNWRLTTSQHYYHLTDEAQRVSPLELEKFRDAILVDARTEQQHSVSRVPNSHSLPLGSGILRMKQFVSANSEQHPIIVYCESDQCAWAEIVAKELSSLGCKNVYVMGEGFRGWKQAFQNE